MLYFFGAWFKCCTRFEDTRFECGIRLPKALRAWFECRTLDWNDGQFFVAMEWRWSYFRNDGMAMVFENFSPSPLMVFGGINHRQRWFFDGFPIFGNQWLTMVTEEKMHISRQTQIHNKLQVNLKNIKSQTQHDSKILFCQFTQNMPM